MNFKDPKEPGPSTAEPSDGNPSVDEAEPMETEAETSSTDEGEAMQIDEAPLSQDWRDQYLNWINRGVLPSDRAQARRVASQAKSFVVIDREL